MATATSRKLACTKCGKEKSTIRNFYLSHSEIYKHNNYRIPVCKECIQERYNELREKYMDEVKAVYHICMNFDVYFNRDLVTSAYTQMANEGQDNLAKAYFAKVNSLPQYKDRSSYDSDALLLDESILDNLIPKEKSNDFELESESEEESNEVEDGKFIVSPSIIKRWGRGYSDEEYQELESIYDEWLEHYDHETLALEKIFRELSELELLKNRARNNGDNKTYKDLSDLMSKKMGDADIKPTQKKAIGEGENESYGTLIEDIEKNEPILLPSVEFEDVDKVYHYIKEFFIKPFARVFGFAEANDQGEVTLNDDFDSSLKEGDESDDED